MRSLPKNNGDKAFTGLNPLGCIGEPAEVARAICWLLDDVQVWGAAQVFGVDGGLSSVQVRA